jgi:hypothetical protein
MRGLALSALLLAACSGGPPSASPLASPSAVVSAAASTAAPSAAATSSAPTATVRVGDTPRSFARLGFDTGSHDGTVTTDGRLQLGSAPAKGSYADPFGQTISDERGTWTSAAVRTPFRFNQLVASWNATTPSGTWIEVQMRASGPSRVTKWYTLAIWSSGDDTIHRTTLKGQDDSDGKVNVDTFEAPDGEPQLAAFELRVTLHRTMGSSATPAVTLLAAVTSQGGDHVILPSPFGGQARELDVPTLSQETHTGHYPEYDGGGEAWCSPTSTAMVLGFWKAGPSAADLAAFPGAHADAQVDHAARFTYDWSYKGAGNWPYNTAYAAQYGLEGFITRLRSLREAELFIQAGIPLIASINGELPGFLFTSTSGHLLVIRGFAANGDVITNDPAVRANAQARKVYPRADFERVWLASFGTVYVIHPPGVRLPATVAGLPTNW